MGPPGNGKTHAVKAIINTIGQPCLYVKSVRTEHRTDEDNIREVFERARKTAPCILVLEDLDSLRISDAAILQLSEATEGFSFAYLKELFLSALMRWIVSPQQRTMEQVLISQVDVLRDQMVSTIVQVAEAESKAMQQDVTASSTPTGVRSRRR